MSAPHHLVSFAAYEALCGIFSVAMWWANDFEPFLFLAGFSLGASAAAAAIILSIRRNPQLFDAREGRSGQ